MNSFPNPFIKEMYDGKTGECIKIWFCSNRLANLIIRKLNRGEWHRVYISLVNKPCGDYSGRMISLNGLIVMVKNEPSY